MKRTSIALVVGASFVAALSAGCPDPVEVGSAPHQQVDMAKERADKAEKKLEQRAEEANAVKE